MLAKQSEFPLGPTYRSSQRWFHGRDSYRPAREPICVSDYAVEPIGKVAAKAFIERHHYSNTFIFEIASFGLYEKRGGAPAELVGVASFSPPSNPRTLERWIGISGQTAGAELGRFVLLDSVGGNGETMFLSRALRLLKAQRPALQAILSYSDPMPRLDLAAGGRARFIGHYGSIYQSSNAIYCGRADRKVVYLTQRGEMMNARNFAKIRNGESGHDYAQANLEAATGVQRWPGESGDSFVARALGAPGIRKVRHPGNHLYLFPLAADRREKAKILQMPRIQEHLSSGYPFPKVLDPAA